MSFGRFVEDREISIIRFSTGGDIARAMRYSVASSRTVVWESDSVPFIKRLAYGNELARHRPVSTINRC